jgi:hypothetical protein
MIDDNLRADIAQTWLSGYLRANGDAYVDHLEDCFKARAKALHRALLSHSPAPQLMRVQEALSQSLGFPSTHALQQVFKHIRDGLKGGDSEEWWAWLEANPSSVFSLVPLYRLIPDFTGKTPLDREHQDYLAKISDALTLHLSLAITDVRDAVARAWATEDDWARLDSRTPLNTPLNGPLMTFEVTGDPTSRKSEGHFHLTQDAHWLWDNVLGSSPERGRLEKVADILQAVSKARELAAAYPEFLPAWAAAANLSETYSKVLQSSWADAHLLLEKGLKQAEALIPKGFKGTIGWLHLDNRVYLRTLYQKMTLELKTRGGDERALRYANKLLRLCPSDNCGVRCLHPLLMARVSLNTVATSKAVARALATGGASGQLHAGLAKLLMGKEDGLSHVLEAVLRVPEFGVCLLNVERIRPWRKFNPRPVRYEDPYAETLAAQAALQDDKILGTWLRRVLCDKALMAEEARLDELLGTRETGLNWENWSAEVLVISQLLTAELLQRYPFDSRVRKD